MNRSGLRPVLQGAVGVLVLVLAGCGGLPREGAIHSGPTREPGAEIEAVVDYTPEGPRPGAAPLDVVGGFLQAMQATPLSTAVAREFLTDEARTEWVPEKSTIVYGVYTVSGRGGEVRLRLSDTAKLGPRGQWLGDSRRGGAIRYDLRLVRERGQWRIANPPDALIIAQAYFETRFTQHFLHFFDRSAQILVPEPVYVPLGEQAPTLLVRGLLAGPDPGLRGVVRTFIPAGTELDDLSVLVSEDGTAQVPLSEEFTELGEQGMDRALAQLGWTLGQVDGVRSFQVTVAGTPLDVPGRGTVHDVQDWPEFDPSVVWASQELFGIRGSRVVSVTDGGSRSVGGLPGSGEFDVRSIGLDLEAQRVAGVTTDGRGVLVAPRDPVGGTGRPSAAGSPVVSGASDLLPPAWDIYRQLWLVDRAPGGATVSVVRSGDVDEIDAPGITGRDVEAFALSRDGTRLAAVLDGRPGDEVVLARVLRREDGTVGGFTRAEPLAVTAPEVSDIRDVAWRTPGSVMLLTGPTPRTSQVLTALVDGSSAAPDDGAPGTGILDTGILRARAMHLVAAPSPGLPGYVQTSRRRLLELSETGGWTATEVEPGLLSPTYVG